MDQGHDEEHHAPQTFLTKYVWSQDHKVIAVQYSCIAILVGLLGLALSNLMRLQLGFPGMFEFINPERYYQFVTMHGKPSCKRIRFDSTSPSRPTRIAMVAYCTAITL